MSSSEEEDVKDDKYVDDEGDFIDSPEPPTFTISEYDVRAGSRPILVKYQLSVPDSSLESGPNHRVRVRDCTVTVPLIFCSGVH